MKKILKNNLYMLMKIWSYSPHYCIFTFIVKLTAILNSLLSIILIRAALNTFSGFMRIEVFWRILFLQLGFVLISIILSTIYNNYSVLKHQKIIQYKMNLELFKKAKTIEILKYDDKEFYNQYSVAINNSSAQAFAVLDVFSGLLISIVSIILLFIFINSLEPLLLFFCILNVASSCFFSVLVAKKKYTQNMEFVTHDRIGSYVRRIFYLKDYALDIKTTRIDENLKEYYQQSVDTSVRIIKKNNLRISSLYFIQSIIHNGNSVGVLIILIIKLMSNEIASGDFAALLNASNQFTNNIRSVVQVIPQLYEHSLYIEQYRNFLNYNSSRFMKAHNQCINNIYNIMLKDVTFNYPNSSYSTDNISLQINKGEKVAIVGPNGAGKTTILKLILGLYPIRKGDISFNGINLDEISLEQLYTKIGVVFQNSQIYAVSIIENVLMRPVDDREKDEKAVWNALTKVGLSEKIRSLSDGIDTVYSRELEEKGVIFSGGEIQRIAIARVLVNDYDLLILDEPANSLDPIIQSELERILIDEKPTQTIIITSHRLTTIKRCDKIYYIESGCIVESGTHQELIDNNNAYVKFFANRIDDSIKS